MSHQAEIAEKLPPNPDSIFLSPACEIDGRTWCEDDIGCRDECGEPTVKYVRSDIAQAAIERLRAALEPFAQYAEAIDCNAWPHVYTDEDEWNVPIGDLRRARAAWRNEQGVKGSDA